MEKKLSFADVAIVPRHNPNGPNSRQDINLERTFKFQNGQTLTAVPIIVANLDVCGVWQLAKELAEFKILTALHKHYTLEELIHIFKQEWSEYCFYTYGLSDQDLNKLNKFINKFGQPKKICFDVANCYIPKALEEVKRARDDFPDSIILAGNICSLEGAELLKRAGADFVKAGISQGRYCNTFGVTGVGYPQWSMLKDINTRFDGLVCSDGSCRDSSCVAKALGIGSDLVMCGSIFAGSSECQGQWIEGPEWEDSPILSGFGTKIPRYTGKFVKKSILTYGMSSTEAMVKYGRCEDYRASEGKVTQVPYKGPVKQVAKDLLNGLRSTATYLGVHNIEDFRGAEFIRI